MDSRCRCNDNAVFDRTCVCRDARRSGADLSAGRSHAALHDRSRQLVAGLFRIHDGVAEHFLLHSDDSLGTGRGISDPFQGKGDPEHREDASALEKKTG